MLNQAIGEVYGVDALGNWTFSVRLNSHMPIIDATQEAITRFKAKFNTRPQKLRLSKTAAQQLAKHFKIKESELYSGKLFGLDIAII